MGVKKPQLIPASGSELQPQRFRRKLLTWYDVHRRDLPWRAGRDPYRVWLSEIMLQQTRVAAVIGHYQEFLRRFPTVQKLAAARQASVLAAWSGLGYYRRARMLHAAAKLLVQEYGGKFPVSEQGLRELPGIGRYTAAAIASIAFDEPIALERWTAANRLLDAKRPGDFNQAMMELGAVVCTPRAPGCLTCPVTEWCATRGELAAARKPVPQKRRKIHYALNCRNGSVFLVQRARDLSLMPGMWELPELAGANGGTSPSFTLRHAITVTDYTVRVWPEGVPSEAAGKWIPLERLNRTALTGLARKILRRAELL
jgi:A/G-specific adenine glycosylase